MNTDFRVSVDFFTHHKARKLKKRLGSAALLSLLQLWAYAAKLRVDGSLSGMSAEDIEIAAEWDGEEGVFVQALVQVGFLNQTESGLALHDWDDHNSWVADADDRSDKARFSRLATVNRKAFDELKAAGVNAISKEDYDRLTNAKRPANDRLTNASAAPTPSPTPSPAYSYSNTQDISENKEHAPAPEFDCGGDTPSFEFQELRELYDREGKAEAPLSGFIEFKALKKAHTFPGNGRIAQALLDLSQKDDKWQRDFRPNLARFLREKWWDKQPQEATARASPPTSAYQQQRQEMAGLATAVLKADEVLNGNGVENKGGDRQAVCALPAAISG